MKTEPEQQPAGQHGSDGMPPLRGPAPATVQELTRKEGDATCQQPQIQQDANAATRSLESTNLGVPPQGESAPTVQPAGAATADKQCPFCGGLGVLLETHDFPRRKLVYVMCHNCGASTSRFKYYDGDELGSDKAWKAWSRRHVAQPTSGKQWTPEIIRAVAGEFGTRQQLEILSKAINASITKAFEEGVRQVGRKREIELERASGKQEQEWTVGDGRWINGKFLFGIYIGADHLLDTFEKDARDIVNAHRASITAERERTEAATNRYCLAVEGEADAKLEISRLKEKEEMITREVVVEKRNHNKTKEQLAEQQRLLNIERSDRDDLVTRLTAAQAAKWDTTSLNEYVAKECQPLVDALVALRDGPQRLSEWACNVIDAALAQWKEKNK